MREQDLRAVAARAVLVVEEDCVFVLRDETACEANTDSIYRLRRKYVSIRAKERS
jgi:hypothetical protein